MGRHRAGASGLADLEAKILDYGFVFRRLPGDEPSSQTPQGAEHFCAIFDELMQFTEDLLSRLHDQRDEGARGRGPATEPIRFRFRRSRARPGLQVADMMRGGRVVATVLPLTLACP